MNDLPLHLQENERAAIWEFAHSMNSLLKDDLCHMWLFGSKARGDFTDDSDLDLLVVLHQMNPRRRGIIQRMAARISLEFDTLINTHIKDKARWDEIVMYEDTLWREVERDGISLDDLITPLRRSLSRSSI